MKRAFVGLSLLILLFFLWQIGKDYNRPYLSLQKKFKELLAKEGEGEPELAAFPVGTRQRWIVDLGRVDRCETCHLGAEDPRFQNVRGPFGTHPDADSHPFERFGCTICHGGQGLATLEKDAHGDVADAESPMVPLKFIESGCGRCHASEQVAGAATLSLGRAALERNGCYACHAVKGHESFRSEAPPIEAVALKTGGEALRRWLKDPKAVDPNATMPRFQLSPSEVEELSNYVFSLAPGNQR